MSYGSKSDWIELVRRIRKLDERVKKLEEIVKMSEPNCPKCNSTDYKYYVDESLADIN